MVKTTSGLALGLCLASSVQAHHAWAILSVPSTDRVQIVADGNRDGRIDDADMVGHNAWAWHGPGAFLLANVDDDDGNGVADAEDADVNGPADALDLALLEIGLGRFVFHVAREIRITVTQGADHVNLFEPYRGTWRLLHGKLTRVAPSTQLAIEARRFANRAFDGVVRIRVEVMDAGGRLVASDEVALRVAPWIMLPNSARTSQLHVATGAYNNAAFLADLTAATTATNTVLLPPYQTSRWQEMWMQDTMEIGYTQLPGLAPMHVVLKANRGQDTYPATLRGPDFGSIQIGTYRPMSNGDDWVDWYGNLEVSHPLADWPLGRIYYGCNTTSGVCLQSEVVDFLEAQEVQAPFWVDTSWLIIKHVDEIFTWVPAQDGSARLVVVSPRVAGTLYPSYYGPYNKGLQARIDTMLEGGAYTINGQAVQYAGLKALLGLTDASIIHVPLFYTDGHPDWSSPINGVYLNGTMVAGDTDMWDAERNLTEELFAQVGIAVIWVDDKVYHDNLGNVHCATNTTRVPMVSQFWQHLPATL